MKVGERADHLWLILKHHTTLDLCGFEIVEGAEGSIGDAFISQRPQPLTGLEFGGIRRQEQQMDAFGHHEVRTGMPARSIQYQQDPPGGTSSHRLGKMGEGDGEHLRGHRRRPDAGSV